MLVNDETGVQLLTVMLTVYTWQITRVMMLVAAHVSYFKFGLIRAHAVWWMQRYATWIFKICISYARAYLNKLSRVCTNITSFTFILEGFVNRGTMKINPFVDDIDYRFSKFLFGYRHSSKFPTCQRLLKTSKKLRVYQVLIKIQSLPSSLMNI